jgi:hypothetical protein
MNTTVKALCVAVGLISVSSAAFAECSVATLKGHYTYWAQGVDADGNVVAEVGQEVFDGAGNVATTLSTAGSAEVTTDTATYTVNTDCTGTSTYASGATYLMHIAPSGDSFVFASSQANVIVAGENTRVGE